MYNYGQKPGSMGTNFIIIFYFYYASSLVCGVVVAFLGTKAGRNAGLMGLKYNFLSVVVLGASVEKVLGNLVDGFFLMSTGTFCDLVAVNLVLLGLNPVVLFAFWFKEETTVAFIFFRERGAGRVKLEGLMMGLLGNANFDLFASSGDIFCVVVSSGTVSVVDGSSVVVV